MNVYHYDFNGVYLGATLANLDPLETQQQGINVYLVPARATTVSPVFQQLGEHQTYHFNGSEWVVVYNYIGYTVYNQSEPYDSYEITELGDLPAGYSLTPIL